MYGRPDVLMMSKPMRRELDKIFKANKQIYYQADFFGKQVMVYDGIPIVVIEKNGPDEVLGFDETVGSDTDCGSIYGVWFDPDEGVAMAVEQSVEVSELLLPDADSDYYRQTISMVAALIVHKPNSAFRIAGITQS